jgi:hypothetical protein
MVAKFKLERIRSIEGDAPPSRNPSRFVGISRHRARSHRH